MQHPLPGGLYLTHHWGLGRDPATAACGGGDNTGMHHALGVLSANATNEELAEVCVLAGRSQADVCSCRSCRHWHFLGV